MTPVGTPSTKTGRSIDGSDVPASVVLRGSECRYAASPAVSHERVIPCRS